MLVENLIFLSDAIALLRLLNTQRTSALGNKAKMKMIRNDALFLFM